MAARQKTVLITAGPTREYFDPVRYISNPSSGKMGYAIAQAALDAGWRVLLVSGPVALAAPRGCELTPVVTGAQMLEACRAQFAQADLLIKAAAVCDFRPKHFLKEKFKKTGEGVSIAFEPVVDILKTLSAERRPGQTLVGFAAETNDVETYALDKLKCKRLDYIVANRVGVQGSGFEADHNAVCIFGANGSRREFGPKLKGELARDIFAYLTQKNGS